MAKTMAEKTDDLLRDTVLQYFSDAKNREKLAQTETAAKVLGIGGGAALGAVTGGAALGAVGGTAATAGATGGGMFSGSLGMLFKFMLLNQAVGIVGGESREYLQGLLQTGEVRYTAALAILENLPVGSEGAKLAEAEARKAMTASGIDQKYQEVVINKSKETQTQLAGQQQAGQEMGIPKLPNESEQQYASRVYTEQKAQSESAQTIQQNLQTTGTPTGEVMDLSGQQLLAYTRLAQEKKKTPQVMEAQKQIEATQLPEGRLKTMELAKQPTAVAQDVLTPAQTQELEVKKKKRRDQLFGGKPYV